MLLGLTTPTSGSIRVFGQDLQKFRRAILQRQVAVVIAGHCHPYATARSSPISVVGVATTTSRLAA